MKHPYLKIAILAALATVVGLYVYAFRSTAAQPTARPTASSAVSLVGDIPVPAPPSSYAAPMENAAERITKKPFSIFITRENSPVSPERFSGYHVGTDFEAFEDETNRDVPVYAICEGPLIQKSRVNGYGGLIIQSCTVDGEPVTVLYGHVSLSSAEAEPGEILHPGDLLAMLGAGFSSETDGERKHLHLGIHKGSSIDLRGYTQSASEINQWIDPAKLFLRQ